LEGDGEAGQLVMGRRVRGKKERVMANTMVGQNIDILVNAAGITHASPLFVTSSQLLEEVNRTNLMGTMYGCQVIGKQMMRNRNGGWCSFSFGLCIGIQGTWLTV